MKNIICAIFALSAITGLWGQKLSSFLPYFSAGELDNLRKGEILVYEDDQINGFFSRFGDEASKSVLDTTSGGKMEALTLQKSLTNLDAYFAKMHQVSTLTGLQYYSRSAKKIKTLIYSSYRVDDLDRKKKLADLAVSGADAKWTMFQDDKSFGPNYYAAVLHKTTNSVHMSITNLTPMKVLFITVFEPGKFQSYFSVIRTDEGFLVYSAFFYKTGYSFGMDKDIKESLTNRLRAFSGWMSGQ
jgi:hypothetical protein